MSAKTYDIRSRLVCIISDDAISDVDIAVIAQHVLGKTNDERLRTALDAMRDTAVEA